MFDLVGGKGFLSYERTDNVFHFKESGQTADGQTERTSSRILLLPEINPVYRIIIQISVVNRERCNILCKQSMSFETVTRDN